jgi:hypothetical protein
MPTPAAPTDVDDQVRIVIDTAPKYFKGESDLTMRNHKMLKILRQYGLIEFNANEYSLTWNVKLREPPVQTATDGARIEFNSTVTDEQLTVDRRGYRATDKMTELEWLSNMGPRAIVNRYQRLTKDVKDSFDKLIAERFYVDANAAGNTNDYQGIGTILGDDGGAVVAGDRCAVPGVAYAGHNTDLANFGGTWDAAPSAGEIYNAALGNAYPWGTGSSEYDAMSPVLANWSSTAWGTNSAKFEDNIELIIAFLTVVMPNRTGFMNGESAPMLVMCDPNLFMKAKNSFRDRNRQIVPVSHQNDLGIPGGSLNIDGAYLCPDYSLGGTDECVVLCPQYMEMFNIHSDLYKVYGPQWTLTDAAYLLYASAWGNYRFQPKYFAKIASYA